MREAFIFVLMNQLFHLCNFLWFLEQVVVLFWEVQTLSFVPAIFLACVPKSGLWGGTLCLAKDPVADRPCTARRDVTSRLNCKNLLVAWIFPQPLSWVVVPLHPFTFSCFYKVSSKPTREQQECGCCSQWELEPVPSCPRCWAGNADTAQGWWVPGGKNHFQINQF